MKLILTKRNKGWVIVKIGSKLRTKSVEDLYSFILDNAISIGISSSRFSKANWINKDIVKSKVILI
jgi:hypothetical protein